LKIFGEPTDELTKLSQLTGLESLDLEGFGSRHESFPALDFLISLSKLKALDFSHNSNISFIEPLTKLTNLTHLNLRYCTYIYDLKFIGHMKNLEYLNLSLVNEKYFNPKDDDYSFLTKLENLRILAIDEGTPQLREEFPLYIPSRKFKIKRKRYGYDSEDD
jgi:Leucine-rich repeat (LRR) protein